MDWLIIIKMYAKLNEAFSNNAFLKITLVTAVLH